MKKMKNIFTRYGSGAHEATIKKAGIILAVLIFAGAFVIAFPREKGEETDAPARQAWETREEKTEASLGEDFTLYRNDTYGFSLEYPKELSVEVFYDEKGETILFQKPNESVGFQIFITPFEEEEEVLTSSRILRDLKSAVIDDPKEVIIGGNTRALVFWSNDPSIGRTREVWFIKGGYLYEITTYARLDGWLARILSTLSF